MSSLVFVGSSLPVHDVQLMFTQVCFGIFFHILVSITPSQVIIVLVLIKSLSGLSSPASWSTLLLLCYHVVFLRRPQTAQTFYSDKDSERPMNDKESLIEFSVVALSATDRGPLGNTTC